MARPRTDIEPRILHAARARFLEDGVDGASLRTIAKDARTSVGMIFYYFPTKDDLFMAVVEEVYADLVADLETRLAGEDSARARIQRAAERLGAASETEIEVMRIVLREALVSSERIGRVMARFRRGHVGMLMRTVMEGMQRGEIDAAIPLPVAAICAGAIAVVPQIARRVLADKLPVGVLPGGTALASLLVEILFRGIGSPGRVKPEGSPAAPHRETPTGSRARRSPRPRRA
jgi:AcrR family transcriptional regulator